MGMPDEVENVVKNLWALRLQLLKDIVDAISDDEHVFSSQPQIDQSESGNRKPYKARMDKAMPSLIDSLGTCYFGMMLLRLPVSIGDLHRWVMREEIIFIRAVRFVPATVKEKLPAEYLQALDTISVPDPDQIREAVDNVGRFYSHHFQVLLPPLNTPLLLYKHIMSLALPISIFPVVRRLAALLSMDFLFLQSAQRQIASSSPEASLISLIVIAVKLQHPFDILPRSAVSLDDPAVLKIDWSKWIEAQKDHEDRIQAGRHLARGSEVHLSEEDVMKMSGEQMDDYLNWYERTWIDEDRAQHKKRPLNDDFRKWFPIVGSSNDNPSLEDLDSAEQAKQDLRSAEQFLTDVISTMQMRNVASESRAGEPEGAEMTMGSYYRHYRVREDLPTDALIFHEAAANMAGMSLETLLRAVMHIEQRLLKWRSKHSRGRRKVGLHGYQVTDFDDDPGGSNATV